jgi:hypothetical protein
LPLLQKVKEAYILWYSYYQKLPKINRYFLGLRIDILFVEIMEGIAVASFLSKEEKQPWVRLAIRKTDTLKVLLMILWEIKSIDDKKYIALSVKIDEVGKMLGGWNGQITRQLQQIKNKQNSPNKKSGEK